MFVHQSTGDAMRNKIERADGHYVLTREQQREALESARALRRTLEERSAARRAAEKNQTTSRR